MDTTNNDWFIVKDIDELTNSARAIVFNNFGKNSNSKTEETTNSVDDLLLEVDPKDQKELDETLSYNESLIIVKQHIKKQIHKKTDKIRYIMNDKIFLSIIESLNERMVSNLLSSLVNKGLVETAYDDEDDEFIFWVKDENKTKKRKTD